METTIPLLHTTSKNKARSASLFYGVWKDGDMPEVDQLTDEIRSSRKLKDDIEAF